jgi:serine/threonine-protein kinase
VQIVLPESAWRRRILRRLGTSGWGTVYGAEHLELGRRFAVKVLRPGFANDPMSVERLRAEARALGRLQSPHIVDAFDVGHTERAYPSSSCRSWPGTR